MTSERLPGLWNGDDGARCRRPWLWLCLAVLSATCLVLPGRALATVPGTPGVPQAPTTVYYDDFENGVGNPAVVLTGYTGGPAARNETYTAAPGWLTDCNGWVLNGNSPDPGVATTHCSTWISIPPLATALGQFEGSPAPTANHVVAAYTAACSIVGSPQYNTGNVCGGPNQLQWETNNPISVAPNRFYTFTVNTVYANCYAAHPLYEFYLVSGGVQVPTFTTPIDACVTYQQQIGNYRVGTTASNGAVLLSGNSVGLRLVNAQGSTTGNDGAFDDVRLVDATPQLDKSFAPGVVNATEPARLTFTVTNTTDLAAKAGWSFTDSLPAGLVVAGEPNVSTTCAGGLVSAPAGGSAVGVSGNLGAGQAACTVSVDVTSAVAGTFTDGPGNVSGVGVNPPGAASVRFLAADLEMAKRAAPEPAVPGTNQTYRLTVTDRGPDAAQNVVVSDSLPAQLSFVSASPACAHAGRVVTCRSASLAAGASETFEVVAHVPSSLEAGFVNTATVASDTHDPHPANNLASSSAQVGRRADLALTKLASSGQVPAGGQVMFRLAVTNQGPSDAADVTVSDPLPAGLHLEAAQPSQGSCTTGAAVLCHLGTLEAGGGAQVLVTATATGSPSGTLANRASVLSGNPDPEAGNNHAGASLSVSPPPVSASPPPVSAQPVSNLQITKTSSPKSAYPGQRVSYTIRVANRGPDAATGVRVTDTSSLNARVLSIHPSQGSCRPGRPLTCTLGTIKPGARATIQATAQLLTAGRQINAASAISTSRDAQPATNLARLRLNARRALHLTKTATPKTARVGQTVTYRLTVNNPTSLPIHHVTVCDKLPSGLQFIAANPQPNLRHSRHCWNYPTLPAHRTKPITLTASVLPGAPRALINRATASARHTTDATARTLVHLLAAPPSVTG